MHRHRTAASSLVRTIALAAVAVLAFACQPIDPGVRSDAESISVHRARALSARIADLPLDELTDSEIVALGYQERARLGLGSPFRLIEFALRDPLLSPEERHAVAYSLLARAQEGRTYEIDPRVLDVIELSGVDRRSHTGARQLDLIERIIGIAPGAASGERMVRLGYELSAAEGTITTSFPSVVSHVAALVADRRRAREDANRLIAAARAARVSPLALVPVWRAERRFAVESPAMAVLTVPEEQAIAVQAPRTALAIRALAQRYASAPLPPAHVSRAGEGAPESLLSPGAATRLLEIAARRDYPPQAPISVALLTNRDGYLDSSAMSAGERTARQVFVDSSYNEERFAAGLALQDTLAAGRGPRLRLIHLQAAVFLRVWNQEQPWFPGDPAPATKDLIARFGLAGVEFGAEVPEAWRPYYRRQLAQGLVDLQRVLPTASLRGLTIRFDRLPHERRALALHDPGSRMLYLPPKTGAGTLAHEFAHDLDWQLARKRYGTSRGYATDLAVSSGRGDRIAYALSGLAASLTQPESAATAHDTRPAEVFARGSDWFVAALLARQGRVGGYLTSFQDPSLTGYGTTRGPDVGGGAVLSLLDILQGIAPIEPAAAAWAVEAHGPQRRLTPWELTRALTTPGNDRAPMERFAVVESIRARSLATIDNASCRLSSAAGLRRLSAAQRQLIEASAAAAARGAAVAAARSVARDASVPPALAEEWMAFRLYGAPEPADSSLKPLEPLLEEIVYHVHTLGKQDSPDLVDAFDFAPRPQLCGGNPFAARAPGAARRSTGPVGRR